METCHRCGTVLPTTPGARYCPNCGEMRATAADPTQAFAAVGHGAGNPGGPGDSAMTGMPGIPGMPAAAGTTGMTWDLPPQPDAEPDPYAELFRPEGGAARTNPNATQVMTPVEAGAVPLGGGYGQPAYDQPIDYQAGGGGT